MMAHRTTMNHPARIISTLLGNLAIWWGALVGSSYAIGFALLMPSLATGRASAFGLGLPLGVPMIGLTLAFAGLGIGRSARLPATASLVGLAMNALPLAMAVALRMV